MSGSGLDQFVRALQGFGIGRLAAILGAGAGAAAILVALMLKLGGAPMSLLYADLDLKEAGQITAQLDQSGVKYEVKGDGSTIFVDRDKVASTRLLLSGKGLPTSGSVGYEIFDNAPAMGQTDFVQTLNRQRALEGELGRTIRSIQGVSFVRVHLVMPKHQLFEEDAEQPSASILIATGGGRIGAEQVRAIRNLVAGAVPELKPERVSITDQQGELLAAEGDGAVDGAGGGERNQVEERIRRTVKDMVEGIVGPGHARVQVSADLDMSSHTTSSEKFDPDGQVVRSTQTSDEKSAENKASSSGATTASQNVPGATASSSASPDSSNTGKQDETTNYEISKTTTTEVQQPGSIKRLSVAVAVDGTTGPAVHGKPGPYAPRSTEDMKRIDQLVRSAMGFDDKRGDQVSRGQRALQPRPGRGGGQRRLGLQLRQERRHARRRAAGAGGRGGLGHLLRRQTDAEGLGRRRRHGHRAQRHRPGSVPTASRSPAPWPMKAARSPCRAPTTASTSPGSKAR